MNANNLLRIPNSDRSREPKSGQTRALSSQPVLAPGVFYGRPTSERQVSELMLSRRDADPHRVIERHSHEDAHFVYVLSGQYVSSARDLPLSGTRPILVYNPPGTTHRDHFAGDRGVFSGAFFTLSLPMHPGGLCGEMLSEDYARAMLHPAAIGLAQELLREFEHWDDVSALAVEDIALALCSHTQNTPASLDRHPPQWLYRVVEQLSVSDTSSPPSLQMLSIEADVHPVYLGRAFKHFMGCTPAALLRRRRLRTALAYVRGTTRSLSEIAAECGFSDHSHMTRAIHAAVGCSPVAYRRRSAG